MGIERKVPVAVADGRVKLDEAVEAIAGTDEGRVVTSMDAVEEGRGGGT